MSVCALPLFLAATPAHGGLVLAPGSYILGDHPDGSAGPPSYGLRLDELIDFSGNHDIFTFSFDHAESNMRIDITEVGVDEFQLHIYGTAFGGLVQDSAYDAVLSGVAEIDFLYTIANTVPGDDDYIVTTPNFTNTGVITFNGMTIDLFDRANAEGYSFRLGNEDDDLGHRGFDGVSGFGWLDHGIAGNHIAASDWIFTVVPAPGPAALLSMAFVLGARRKRRRD